MRYSALHRRSVELTKMAQVDAYQQKTEWSCSAGTLKSVAQHYGIDLSEEEIVKAIGAREGRGAETTDIVEGARKLGFDASEGSFPSLAKAKETLKSGVPIIADIQSFNYPGKGHYIVLTGFKPDKGFIVMDPNTKGKTAIPNWRVLSEEKLEEIWWDRAMAPPHKLMKRWGVMVRPKTKEKTGGGKAGLGKRLLRSASDTPLEKTVPTKKVKLLPGTPGKPDPPSVQAYKAREEAWWDGFYKERAEEAAKRKGPGMRMALLKYANDPVKEKITLHGIPISLEWREGETRKYFNHDPLKKKSTGTIDYNKKMKADYGYVRGVMDADGEELDVYLGPNRDSTKVFVLEKLRSSDASFDENKIMLGYDSKEEAKKSYLQHQGKDEMGKVREVTLERFKKEFSSKKKIAQSRTKKLSSGDLLGWRAMRRAKGESARADPLPMMKIGEVRAFADELTKIASAGSAFDALSIGAKAGGLIGGVREAASDDQEPGKLRRVIKGLGAGAIIGALIALGMQRNAVGKTTLPRLK